MQPRIRPQLLLERLEDRLVPAFNASFNPTTSAWTLTQVADNGAVTVAVNAGQLQITEGAGTPIILGPAGASLSITMLSSTSNLEVDLNSGLNGNLTINLASGDRALTLGGTANSLGGNLSVTATTGNQSVELAANAGLSVGGSGTIDLGLGSDSVTSANSATFGTDLILRGVNESEHIGAWTIGRNYSQDVSSETVTSGFQDRATSTGFTTVGGNFTYLGNSLADEVFLFEGANIGGNLYANLGANYDHSNIQEVVLDNNRVIALGGVPLLNNPVTIGGSVTVIAGQNPYTTNVFATDTATTIGGNISINMSAEGRGGTGPNIAAGFADFFGTFGGSSITYTGGVFADQVEYGMTGSRAHFSANLGPGADTFTLDAGASLSYLFVDFGPGPGDKFVNNYGRPFDFPVVLRNLG